MQIISDKIKYIAIGTGSAFAAGGLIFAFRKKDVQAMLERKKEKAMTEMMPQCVKVMLPSIPKEKRNETVKNLMEALAKEGSEDMTAIEKKEYLTKLSAQIKV